MHANLNPFGINEHNEIRKKLKEICWTFAKSPFTYATCMVPMKNTGCEGFKTLAWMAMHANLKTILKWRTKQNSENNQNKYVKLAQRVLLRGFCGWAWFAMHAILNPFRNERRIILYPLVPSLQCQDSLALTSHVFNSWSLHCILAVSFGSIAMSLGVV